MFKLVENPTFTHKVSVQVPCDGGHRSETFKATYRVMKIDEIAAFDLNDGDSSVDFLRAVVVRLDDIATETGEPISYSDEVLNAVMALPYARTALALGYFDAIGKARAGN